MKKLQVVHLSVYATVPSYRRDSPWRTKRGHLLEVHMFYILPASRHCFLTKSSPALLCCSHRKYFIGYKWLLLAVIQQKRLKKLQKDLGRKVVQWGSLQMKFYPMCWRAWWETLSKLTSKLCSRCFFKMLYFFIDNSKYMRTCKMLQSGTMVMI